jgi:serine/threonine protein kinase/Tol biopolymer transport system component
MDPERWRQITALFHDALARERTERAAFLEEACARDGELRDEVERLLAAHEEAGALEPERATSTGLVGRQLGGYRVMEEIGRGGMGRVYRAVDGALGREVAIKVLPQEFASDPERVKRFEREARLIAAVSHPKVATIHGLLRDGETRFLVLELVAGETLQDRLDRGPIPVEEALRLAVQIAEALEAAHGLGVVHRDLKPSNVKVTEEGAVKVLDFGLAKAFRDPPSGETGGEASLPAESATTREGAVLGTPPYMSPEQVGGARVDHRTDIWSFGVVLWEMLAGERPFVGETTARVFGAVLRDEPAWARLPPATPEAVRALLRRCLTRERRNRLQAIGEARICLETWLSNPAPPAGTTGPTRKLGRRAVAALLLCFLAGGVSGWVSARHRPAPREGVLRLSLSLPSSPRHLAHAAISADGRLLVLADDGDGTEGLWLQSLDGESLKQLAGTTGARFPFWSPDSRSIAFFADPKLKRLNLSDGHVLEICDAPLGRGGTWSPDGVIVFTPASSGGLMRVDAGGGTPEPLTRTDLSRRETNHRFPEFLPDGRTFLYYNLQGTATTNEVFASSLDRPDLRTKVVDATSRAVYVPSAGGGPGYLLWTRDTTLLAARFDARRLAIQGEPVALAEDVGSRTPSLEGSPAFSVSRTGLIVHSRPPHADAELTWLSRDGGRLPVDGAPSEIPSDLSVASVRLSPDGNSALLCHRTSLNMDIWRLELNRGVAARLTSGPDWDCEPAWSPDSRSIAFISDGPMNVFRMDADGASPPERMTRSVNNQDLDDWSRDGKYLLYTERTSTTGDDLFILPLEGARSPMPFLQGPFNEDAARFSPDGHWIAYTSDETGRAEVYVQPFAGPGAKVKVSDVGGSAPRWRGDGAELYYLSKGQIMGVTLRERGRTLEAAPARKIVDLPPGASKAFEVTDDGQRFLTLVSTGPASAEPLTVIAHWTELFRARATR